MKRSGVHIPQKLTKATSDYTILNPTVASGSGAGGGSSGISDPIPDESWWWAGVKGFFSGLGSGVHNALDIGGLIPGVGEIADGANALIYLAEGDKFMAGVSAAAMIPVAGWGATGGKVLMKGAAAVGDVAKVATATVVQSGSHKLSVNAAKQIIEANGLKIHPNELGKLLDKAKKRETLPANHHGKICINGDYLDSEGRWLVNFLP